MANPVRGRALTILAVLFAALAVSNLVKPLELYPDHGFVLLGARLKGLANQIAGPLFGLYLLAYAFGIWGLRRFALPMGIVYALYVTTNLVLFPFRTPPAAEPRSAAFLVVYVVIALGCSWGAVRLLRARADVLR